MSKVSPFSIVTSDCTIDSILQSGVCAEKVLSSLGFPDCAHCSVRFDETLEEATVNYGLNLEAVLMALNANLVKERVEKAMNGSGSDMKDDNKGTETKRDNGETR